MLDHDDIVSRLRRYKRGPCIEAAEEIDRLRRRLLAEENAYDILRLECEKLTTDLATCRRILPAHIERVMYEGEG